jgi:hypothetical protein
MVYFQIKNSDLGKFWRVLQRKILVYFMAIWSILRPVGKFCAHLVYFRVIWHILPVLSWHQDDLATLIWSTSLKYDTSRYLELKRFFPK